MKTIPLFALSSSILLLAGCPERPRPQDTPSPQPPTVSERLSNAVDRTRAAADDAHGALETKLADWNLTPAEIEADLKKSGRIVRDKTLAAGERAGGAIDNVRVVSVINGKYIADRDLSAFKIDVDANDSVVTLTGSVDTPQLAGRAVALALDTEGVAQVVGLLKVGSLNTSGAL